MKNLPNSSYRWIIIALVVILGLLVYGIRHSFAAFFPPILNEFGWTRGSTSLMFSLNMIFYGAFAPIAGTLADRWKPKFTLIIGILLLSIGAAACALVYELWHFFILYGIIMSVGMAFAGAPIIIPMVANWFPEKRGTAIGIGAAGGMLSFAMVTYAEFLISSSGWRIAFVLLAATVTGVAIPLVLGFFRYRPEQAQQPLEEAAPNTIKPSGNIQDLPDTGQPHGNLLSRAQVLKDYRLWLLVFAYLLYMGLANYMIVAHQVIFFIDLGYDNLFAASLAGSVGILAALGTLSGFLSDYLGRERVLTLSATLSIVSILILLSQRDASNPLALYIFAFCFGFSLGLNMPTFMSAASDIFGGQHFGMVNGLILMGFGLGGAIGPWLGGYIFDTTGSYTQAFIISIAAYVISCLSFWIAAPRKASHIK